VLAAGGGGVQVSALGAVSLLQLRDLRLLRGQRGLGARGLLAQLGRARLRVRQLLGQARGVQLRRAQPRLGLRGRGRGGARALLVRGQRRHRRPARRRGVVSVGPRHRRVPTAVQAALRANTLDAGLPAALLPRRCQAI